MVDIVERLLSKCWYAGKPSLTGARKGCSMDVLHCNKPGVHNWLNQICCLSGLCLGILLPNVSCCVHCVTLCSVVNWGQPGDNLGTNLCGCVSCCGCALRVGLNTTTCLSVQLTAWLAACDGHWLHNASRILGGSLMLGRCNFVGNVFMCLFCSAGLQRTVLHAHGHSSDWLVTSQGTSQSVLLSALIGVNVVSHTLSESEKYRTPQTPRQYGILHSPTKGPLNGRQVTKGQRCHHCRWSVCSSPAYSYA